MLCGRCCVTEPPTKLALRLDIFIEILPRTRVNKPLGRSECRILLPRASIGGRVDHTAGPENSPIRISS
jgi:hypothetical protein